jgi:hypothetical protein
MLTVAEAADRVGKNPDQDLSSIEDELFPMAELPDDWQVGDDEKPAPNWVAALHRSHSGH